MSLIKWRWLCFAWMKVSMGMAIETQAVEVRKVHRPSGLVDLQARRAHYRPFIGRLWFRFKTSEWN